jgi:hypothetical protein
VAFLELSSAFGSNSQASFQKGHDAVTWYAFLAMKKKATYRIRNWSEYTASLKQRGRLTIWTHGNQKHKNGPFQSAILKQSPRDRRIHNGNTFRIKGMSECGRS